MIETSTQYITQSEAAKMRDCTVAAINNLVKRKRIRAMIVYGKKLVLRSDVENFKALPKGRRKAKAARK